MLMSTHLAVIGFVPVFLKHCSTATFSYKFMSCTYSNYSARARRTCFGSNATPDTSSQAVSIVSASGSSTVWYFFFMSLATFIRPLLVDDSLLMSINITCPVVSASMCFRDALHLAWHNCLGYICASPVLPPYNLMCLCIMYPMLFGHLPNCCAMHTEFVMIPILFPAGPSWPSSRDSSPYMH